MNKLNKPKFEVTQSARRLYIYVQALKNNINVNSWSTRTKIYEE
jgi:hypothetical protein